MHTLIPEKYMGDSSIIRSLYSISLFIYFLQRKMTVNTPNLNLQQKKNTLQLENSTKQNV